MVVHLFQRRDSLHSFIPVMHLNKAVWEYFTTTGTPRCTHSDNSRSFGFIIITFILNVFFEIRLVKLVLIIDRILRSLVNERVIVLCFKTLILLREHICLLTARCHGR